MTALFYKDSIHSLQTFWEEKGKTGSFERGYHIRLDGILQMIEKMTNLLEGKLVLDVGCGPGIIASHFPNNTTIIGLDFSISMIQSAINRIQRLIRGTAFNLPVANDIFEVVTCFFVMSDYSLKKPFFIEVNRVLQTNGLFVFADYSPNDEHWRLKKRIRTLLGKDCNIFIEPTDCLQNKLKQTGFYVQQTESITFHPTFELKRYVTSDKELQHIAKSDPMVWKYLQHLTHWKKIKREFILLLAKKRFSIP